MALERHGLLATEPVMMMAGDRATAVVRVRITAAGRRAVEGAILAALLYKMPMQGISVSEPQGMVVCLRCIEHGPDPFLSVPSQPPEGRGQFLQPFVAICERETAGLQTQVVTI